MRQKPARKRLAAICSIIVGTPNEMTETSNICYFACRSEMPFSLFFRVSACPLYLIIVTSPR